MTDKLKVLFLCTGNSCRSQMAEGWTRHIKSNTIEPYSAGIVAHGLNPRAVLVMKEVGVNISHHTSKKITSVMNISFDHVITVCSDAEKHCPVFSGKVQVSRFSFDDPPNLARFAQSEEEALSHFRRVRDEIRAFIETLPPRQP